ncbi:MAG: hypothetical protein AB4426_10300 [Xenococcaceae cyanobacterium]
MWNLSEVDDLEIDSITREIFQKYKYALVYIGVDFSREDVQLAIADCSYGMEEAFQATISYWLWKKKNNQEFEYPSAFLIAALNDQWKPFHWTDEYLDNPNFKSPCQRWWEEAAVAWGTDVRNELVADVAETDSGYEYVLFRSGKTLSLRIAKVWGWQRVLEYARRLNA